MHHDVYNAILRSEVCSMLESEKYFAIICISILACYLPLLNRAIKTMKTRTFPDHDYCPTSTHVIMPGVGELQYLSYCFFSATSPTAPKKCDRVFKYGEELSPLDFGRRTNCVHSA